MGSTMADAQLVTALRSAYASTPIKLKIIDLYVVFLLATVLVQVIYMSLVGSFPFNAFLSGILSCIGSAVLAVCLRMQVNKENKEFKDLPPERAFADFVLSQGAYTVVMASSEGQCVQKEKEKNCSDFLLRL